MLQIKRKSHVANANKFSSKSRIALFVASLSMKSNVKVVQNRVIYQSKTNGEKQNKSKIHIMPANKQNVTKACRLWGISSIFTLIAIGLAYIWVNYPDDLILKVIIILIMIASYFVLCLGFYYWFKAIKKQ